MTEEKNEQRKKIMIIEKGVWVEIIVIERGGAWLMKECRGKR